jgi:hypothetical protein
MRLSPLSFQNTYASAKASPHSLARTGVRLNDPLGYVRFNTGDMNLRFNLFLHGLHGRGPVGEKLKNSNGWVHLFPPAQFCSDLHEAMKLLCQEGLITLTADRGNHGHLVTLNPHTNNPHFPYSIHALDVELPAIRTNRKRVDLKSNALVNFNGEACPYPNKPLYEHLEDKEPVITGFGSNSDNELKLPIHFNYQVLANPHHARIKFGHDRKQFNLAEDQDQLPSSVIEGLNIISEVLRPFDPRLPYTQPYHFGGNS